MWGGLECTVARVGDTYLDQTLLNGHENRPEDLDAFAALGIRAIRYPVLWERIAPGGLDEADWRWTDERLARLRDLGLRPIVTLLHHGSGPRHTDLTRPDFAPKLAAFARRVAERYPWLDLYTPVNEPLTTARFSGLYGHWYPHARDHRTFLRCLVNQVEGVRLAMRAIREVNPVARLVQTEDLGRAFSTPRLAYQAAHKNHRRWLSLDLLLGRVDRQHPLRDYLRQALPEEELRALDAGQEAPCPPDIVGINHYLSSERFLDERLERYPDVTPSDNGRDRYVDVAATRVLSPGPTGLENLLREAWDRYRLPVAVTEVHNGSTRDEQLRWLREAWDAAQRLHLNGVDIRAVTVWALLGSYEWNSLLTRRTGYYEPGPFDVRSGQPRPTALAHLVRDLAGAGQADHPVLDAPGWWHRETRYIWPASPGCASTRAARLKPPARRRLPRPVLIAGGGGVLAGCFARLCAARGLPHRVLSRRELDVADPASVAAAVARLRPWAVINGAGYARVDRAEREAERCRRENLRGAEVLAAACARAGIRLLALSTHLVFDGGKPDPYLEADGTAPLGVYAGSKAEAERALLAACPDALLVRSGAFFGPWDERNVAARTLRAAPQGREVAAACDVAVSPPTCRTWATWRSTC